MADVFGMVLAGVFCQYNIYFTLHVIVINYRNCFQIERMCFTLDWRMIIILDTSSVHQIDLDIFTIVLADVF